MSVTLGRLRKGSAGNRSRGKGATIGALVGILGMQDLVNADIPQTDWLTPVSVAEVQQAGAEPGHLEWFSSELLEDEVVSTAQEPKEPEITPPVSAPVVEIKPSNPLRFLGELERGGLVGAAQIGLDHDPLFINEDERGPISRRTRVRLDPESTVSLSAFGGEEAGHFIFDRATRRF